MPASLKPPNHQSPARNAFSRITLMTSSALSLQSYRRHYTTIHRVAVLMISKLNPFTFIQTISRHSEDSRMLCMNIKAHGKCSCTSVCVHFLLHRLKSGQLAVLFSCVVHVCKKGTSCIIYIDSMII